MDFWTGIVLFIFINGALCQSWWSSSTPSGGACEISFNSTVLNSLDEVSPETFVMDSIEVLSYSRGQLNDWVFRTCRNFEMIVSRLNQSCTEREIKQSDAAEYASFKKSVALAAGHEYFCANAGANLKDFVLNNGPQCVQDTIRYWNECPSTSSNSRRPTNVIFTTYTFSTDACSFLVTTERCYMSAFNQSSLCIGNAPRHFQTYIGILLESVACADRNVFGRAPPIGFRDLPNFNVRQHPSIDNQDPNSFNRNQQTNIDRIGFNSQDFGLNRNNFNNGNGQFPPNNQFSRDAISRPQNGFGNYFPGSQGQPSDINSQFGINSQNPQDQNHFSSGFSNDRNHNHPVTPRVYNNSNYFNPNIDSNARNFGNQNGFQQNPNSNWNRPDMPNNPYGDDSRNSWRNDPSQNPNSGSYDPNYLNSRPGSSFNDARERNSYNNSVEEVKIAVSAFVLTIGSILILQ